jgi:uncharacterized membrane protein YphA (DoxX/SURF4 family)
MLRTNAGRAVILIRLMVGLVFVSEGIQKFLYAEAQGAGRFAKIGIPAPAIMGPFVGVLELVCGVLILLGLATRVAAVLLALDMIVAIASTKIPVLIGHGYLLFAHTLAPKAGFWAFLHESRTDVSMLCGSVYLAIVGAGPWSLDAKLSGGAGLGNGKQVRPEDRVPVDHHLHVPRVGE